MEGTVGNIVARLTVFRRHLDFNRCALGTYCRPFRRERELGHRESTSDRLCAGEARDRLPHRRRKT